MRDLIYPTPAQVHRDINRLGSSWLKESYLIATEGEGLGVILY